MLKQRLSTWSKTYIIEDEFIAYAPLTIIILTITQQKGAISMHFRANFSAKEAVEGN